MRQFLLDAGLLPVNLVRDFPTRSGRLLGILSTLPESGSGTATVAWSHALLWSLFDLIGGPEFFQFILRRIAQTRPLSSAEIDAAAKVLGPKAVRYRDVRIAYGGLLRFVFGQNNNRAFTTWHTVNIPEKRAMDLSLIVHELTHSYQYERVGSVYIGEGLWAQLTQGRKAYDYGGSNGLAEARAAGKCYRDYNREQQGQIAQDYCTLVLAGQETKAYEPFIAELKMGLI